jgi:CRP/FNR family cyclic AMP-dependent transcriptional regulator
MAARNEYLKHLATVPLFASLSNSDLQKIAKISDEVTVEAGRVLFEQGAVGHEAYVIVDGEASVKRGDTELAVMGAGECFGELALLDRGPRTATVTALTPLTVLVLGQREFGGLVDEVPAIARQLLATLAGRIRELDEAVFP